MTSYILARPQANILTRLAAAVPEALAERELNAEHRRGITALPRVDDRLLGDIGLARADLMAALHGGKPLRPGR